MHQLITILLVLAPSFLWSQASTVVNLHTYGGLGNDFAEDIEATTDGGYIVAGSTSSNSSGNTDVYLLKVDAACNYEWSTAIGGSNNDWGYSIKQTHDNGYIIAASSNSYGNGGYDAVLMKRDQFGDFEWRKTYGGQDWDFIYSVIQTYDSGYVFCGETYNNSTGLSDVYIVKTDSSGTILWSQTIGNSLIDRGNSVIETSDSSIVVAGSTNTLIDSNEIYVIKLSRTGTLLWENSYGLSGDETANQIIEAANGDYILAGSTTSFGIDKNFYVQRIDANGVEIWGQDYGNTKDEEAFDLKENLNGEITIVGSTESFGAGMKDAALFVITANGAWASLGPTYGNNLNDVFKSITIGNNGDLCIAGHTNSFGNGLNDVFLAKIDSVVLGPQTTITHNLDLIPLGVYENNENINFNLFPNPARDVININSSYTKTSTIQLIDITGKEVMTAVLKNNTTQLSLTDLENGIYFYTIFSEQREILIMGKFVIAH